MKNWREVDLFNEGNEGNERKPHEAMTFKQTYG